MTATPDFAWGYLIGAIVVFFIGSVVVRVKEDSDLIPFAFVCAVLWPGIVILALIGGVGYLIFMSARPFATYLKNRGVGA